MDQQTNANRPSGLPRLSRLPVPRAVRPLPSRDDLQQQPSRIGAPSSRLRSAPSREQLSNSVSTYQPPKARAPAAGVWHDGSHSTLTTGPQPLRKTTSTALLRKPSRPIRREEEPVRLDSSEEERIQPPTNYANEDNRVESRGHGPSLSERTMETLQNIIPASPAVRRRDSTFFNPESPMQPSSRPSSKDSLIAPPLRSFSERPPSSSGSDRTAATDFRASTNTFRHPQTSLESHTPLKRPSTVKSLKTPGSIRSLKTGSAAKAPPGNFDSFVRENSPSPVKSTNFGKIKSGSTTLGARSLKPRGSVQGLFRQPSVPALDQSAELSKRDQSPKRVAAVKPPTSRAARGPMAQPAAEDNPPQTPPRTPPKSSSALRDQIAKAKAAQRAAAVSKPASSISPSNEDEIPVVPVDTFDFGLTDDPFNSQSKEGGAKGLLRKRIDAARTDGRLNIAGMGFKEIPGEVMNMYDTSGANDGSWAETVDLTRFIAADNEFEMLGEDSFPDIDPREAMEDEESKGNQFGGLETLDLHGNVLVALPLGLRRLELLTSLNLSNNRLENNCFGVISQIPCLRDLKIAGNGLTGSLDEGVTKLRNLETLDIQRNALTSLPDALADLVRLKVLNIAENRFASLPFEILRQLPLIEILAAKNALGGVLVAEEVDELPLLQVLDVTGNALKSISHSKLLLPALHQLSCSSNRLVDLPDLTSWVSLLTLTADGNNISTIPAGFVGLPKVSNVDFSGNNLKVLDDRIGGMDNLHVFRISGNPLREKKFSGMTTDDLKRALKARMEPEPIELAAERDTEDGSFYSAQASPTSPGSADWPIKAGGVLDRSNTQSHSLNPVIAAKIAAMTAIKELQLQHNKFREIPVSVAFFAATLTTLNLSHNELTSDTFLTDDLELPALKDLNLSSNTFNSLQPLIQHLQAPNLEKLDISFNRLTSLPPLKAHFPSLWTLLTSNNTIRELPPGSVKGLRVLDCSSNEISSLNARIGLLGHPGGLEMLNVKGNRFRVPKYTILEKGTEATLAWLRDRIPASSGESSPAEVD